MGHGHRNLVCLYWTGFLGLQLCLAQDQPKRPCHIRLTAAPSQGFKTGGAIAHCTTAYDNTVQGSAVNIGSPAILRKDSRPEAILKFHCLLEYSPCLRFLVSMLQLFTLVCEINVPARINMLPGEFYKDNNVPPGILD